MLLIISFTFTYDGLAWVCFHSETVVCFPPVPVQLVLNLPSHNWTNVILLATYQLFSLFSSEETKKIISQSVSTNALTDIMLFVLMGQSVSVSRDTLWPHYHKWHYINKGISGSVKIWAESVFKKKCIFPQFIVHLKVNLRWNSRLETFLRVL